MTDLGDRDIARTRATRKHKNIAPDEFHSGLKGMGAAKAALGPLIKRNRNLAYRIWRAVGEAGLQGAPALGHLAALLIHKARERDYPVPPGTLKAAELRLGFNDPPAPSRPRPVPRAARPQRGRGEFDTLA